MLNKFFKFPFPFSRPSPKKREEFIIFNLNVHNATRIWSANNFSKNYDNELDIREIIENRKVSTKVFFNQN